MEINKLIKVLEQIRDANADTYIQVFLPIEDADYGPCVKTITEVDKTDAPIGIVTIK